MYFQASTWMENVMVHERLTLTTVRYCIIRPSTRASWNWSLYWGKPISSNQPKWVKIRHELILMLIQASSAVTCQNTILYKSSVKIQFLVLNADYIFHLTHYFSLFGLWRENWFKWEHTASEVQNTPCRKSLTGDPDVVQLWRFLYSSSGECPQSQLQLLPVQWILHTHLLRSERTVCHNKAKHWGK